MLNATYAFNAHCMLKAHYMLNAPYVFNAHYIFNANAYSDFKCALANYGSVKVIN